LRLLQHITLSKPVVIFWCFDAEVCLSIDKDGSPKIERIYGNQRLSELKGALKVFVKAEGWDETEKMTSASLTLTLVLPTPFFRNSGRSLST
jgi:hypothetical protein